MDAIHVHLCLTVFYIWVDGFAYMVSHLAFNFGTRFESHWGHFVDVVYSLLDCVYFPLEKVSGVCLPNLKLKPLFCAFASYG